MNEDLPFVFKKESSRRKYFFQSAEILSLRAVTLSMLLYFVAVLQMSLRWGSASRISAVILHFRKDQVVATDKHTAEILKGSASSGRAARERWRTGRLFPRIG